MTVIKYWSHSSFPSFWEKRITRSTLQKLLQSYWNRFCCHRINDLLTFVINHNFHWIFVLLAIFWPRLPPDDQFNGFLSIPLLPSCTFGINRGLWHCNLHVKISEGEKSDKMFFTKLKNNSSFWYNAWISECYFENHTCKNSWLLFDLQPPCGWKPHFWWSLQLLFSRC